MALTAETIRSFVERLQRDVALVEPTAVIGVFDLVGHEWIVRSTRQADPDEEFGDDGWIARIHGADRLVRDDNVLVELADFAQDVVIDETGKSWPDVEHEGRVVHLDPKAHDGDVCWMYKGEVVLRVGDLGTAL